MKTPGTNNTKTELHHKLYTFVCSVIAIRKRLLKNDVSRRNKMLMWQTLTTLEKLIMVNRYDEDRLMAGFFIRHAQEIESLIPGTGSKLHEKWAQRFVELKQLALHKYISTQVKSKKLTAIS